jgi:DNA-directed RNA polymerase subunit F
MSNQDDTRRVSLAEVKNILKKVEKNRKELLYEQRIALEHAQKFAKLPANKTDMMLKELMDIELIHEAHAYKIADILPTSIDDVKTIFAKERVSLKDSDIKSILDIVNKYYIE